MADETLIVAVPSATKIRTTNCRFLLIYDLIDAGGNKVGVKPLRFNADDSDLTAGQQTTCVNFAKAAAQVKGLVA